MLLSVSDNGRGMDGETRARLFEPFFSARRGGLGLGLTTTKSVLSAHEVLLSVESAPGRGTTFLLRFPPVREGSELAGGSQVPGPEERAN